MSLLLNKSQGTHKLVVDQLTLRKETEKYKNEYKRKNHKIEIRWACPEFISSHPLTHF